MNTAPDARWNHSAPPVTANPARPATSRGDDCTADHTALLDRREADIVVPAGLTLLTTLLCAAVLGSSPLALLALVALVAVAGLTAAAL